MKRRPPRDKFCCFPADVTREALDAIAALDRGEGIDPTTEDLDYMRKTGWFPERIVRWAESGA
jgi:hypothetical protein